VYGGHSETLSKKPFSNQGCVNFKSFFATDISMALCIASQKWRGPEWVHFGGMERSSQKIWRKKSKGDDSSRPWGPLGRYQTNNLECLYYNSFSFFLCLFVLQILPPSIGMSLSAYIFLSLSVCLFIGLFFCLTAPLFVTVFLFFFLFLSFYFSLFFSVPNFLGSKYLSVS